MPICTGCLKNKDSSEFCLKHKNSDRLQHRCKECTRASSKAHFEANKEYYRNKNSLRKEQNKSIVRKYVWDWLCNNPCVDCGEVDPFVLDFDHVRGKKKKAISLMINGSYNLSTVIEEIEKCEMRCANCHRRKTAKQFSYWSDMI